jgi:hypothetical protein
MQLVRAGPRQKLLQELGSGYQREPRLLSQRRGYLVPEAGELA